jgi:hypothetical protein
MEGRLSDSDNPRSDPDWHGVIIFDRLTSEVAAQYHGRCTQQDLRDQCLLAAEFYNHAWVGIEVPNGKTVVDGFRQYQNLYRKQIHDFQDVEQDTDEYGWRTTTMTRPWLVDGLIGIIRDDELIIYSDELLGEMRTFIRDKTGKPIHLRGEHDDLLFGLMIAIQIHQRCPLKAISYQFDHAGGQDEPKVIPSYLLPGGVDDGADMFVGARNG